MRLFEDARRLPKLPYRILLVGRFSAGPPSAATGFGTGARRVERGDFDSILGELLGGLSVEIPEWGGAVDLTVKSLKSLRPEAIVRQIPGGTALAQARDAVEAYRAGKIGPGEVARIVGESGVPEVVRDTVLAALATEAPGGAAEAPPAGAPGAQAPKPAPSARAEEGLLSMVDLPGDGGGDAAAAPPAAAGVGGIGRAISAIGRSGGGAAQPAPTAARAAAADQALAALDDLLGFLVGPVLSNPDFRALEATWRGLKFLLDRTDPRAGVTIEIRDLPDGDLAALLRDRVVPEETESATASPLSLIVWMPQLELAPGILEVLDEVAHQAESIATPVLAWAGADFAQTVSATKEWAAFRGRPAAAWLALAVNPFLLRAPYGDAGERLAGFRFTEPGGSSVAGSWGNPALALAAASARSFAESGWPTRFEGGAEGTIENLPLRPVVAGSAERYLASGEALSDSRAAALVKEGFIPLVAAWDRDAAQIFAAPTVRAPAEGAADPEAARERITLRRALAAGRSARFLAVVRRSLPGDAGDDEVAAALAGALAALAPGAAEPPVVRVLDRSAGAGPIRVSLSWKPGPPVLPRRATLDLDLAI